MKSQLTARFEAALAAEESLAGLAGQLHSEGLSQVEIYDCFFRFRHQLLTEDRDLPAARLAAVLDRIVGWCSPAERLFPAALTREQLADFYASRPAAGEQVLGFDPAELLARYDRQQRREVELPGLFKETLAGELVRFTYPDGYGLVLASRLDPDRADPAIAAQVDAFRQAGAGLEWQAFAHDRPPDLEQRLARQGFTPGPRQDLLVLDLGQAAEELLEPPAADLRPITHPGRLEPVLRLGEAAGLGGPALERLAGRLRAGLEAPDSLNLYIGYTNGLPAQAAWLHFSPDSLFAGLEGLPGWQPGAPGGRDLDTALLQACLQEAVRRERACAALCAPAAHPALETLGFHRLSSLRTWRA